MNSRLLFVLVFVVLLIPITAFAQSASNIPIDAKHYGEFSVKNLKVSEKEFYKEISMEMHIKVQNLELEDAVFVAPLSIRLINENGKLYLPKVSECKTPVTITILGTKGGTGGFPVCYWVEKEFNNFKIQYHNDITQKNSEIGKIDLSQQSIQTESPFESVTDIKIQDVEKTSKDFFSQIIDFFKRLFSFS